ncbi:hypothetical protein [Marinivivus vitaminiproducens]|uniref:hypothetical protein n=1 Tax=Marinivivus vitaminiproducens TaxID=3035935 RepID=UPI0027AB85C7|nr:hypothetical protein P4R82_00595 [Geminicoccaceae bacterium SCSIO 64248]
MAMGSTKRYALEAGVLFMEWSRGRGRFRVIELQALTAWLRLDFTSLRRALSLSEATAREAVEAAFEKRAPVLAAWFRIGCDTVALQRRAADGSLIDAGDAAVLAYRHALAEAGVETATIQAVVRLIVGLADHLPGTRPLVYRDAHAVLAVAATRSNGNLPATLALDEVGRALTAAMGMEKAGGPGRAARRFNGGFLAFLR